MKASPTLADFAVTFRHLLANQPKEKLSDYFMIWSVILVSRAMIGDREIDVEDLPRKHIHNDEMFFNLVERFCHEQEIIYESAKEGGVTLIKW